MLCIYIQYRYAMYELVVVLLQPLLDSMDVLRTCIRSNRD